MIRSLRILVRLAAIGASFFAMENLSIRPYMANRVLRRVDTRTHAAAADPNSQRAVIRARISMNELGTISDIQKDEVNYEMLFAANARLLNRPGDALAHYDTALRFDHRPEIYLERGATLLELGRDSEAIANFVLAAEFDPDIVETLDPPIRARVVAQLRG